MLPVFDNRLLKKLGALPTLYGWRGARATQTVNVSPYLSDALVSFCLLSLTCLFLLVGMYSWFRVTSSSAHRNRNKPVLNRLFPPPAESAGQSSSYFFCLQICKAKTSIVYFNTTGCPPPVLYLGMGKLVQAVRITT